MSDAKTTWIASGMRTPFTKMDGGLGKLGAIELSIPVAQAMVSLADDGPDLMVWGAVAPNLTYSNLAREVALDAGMDPHIPAYSTVMACSTSMAGALQAAGMVGAGGRHLALVGGVESMSRVQIGLNQQTSDWLRRVSQARSAEDRIKRVGEIPLTSLGLYTPKVANRTTGKSMGEHCEEMAKEWGISREDQDQIALDSHMRSVAAWERGFYDSLVLAIEGVRRDAFPRPGTSLEKLAALKPAFDRTSGRGTLTAGNSSPLTDGAAAVWVADHEGAERLPQDTPRVKLVDYEIAAVDLHHEGLLMAPAYAIPRVLARNELRFEDVALFEIHEAFGAQVLANLAGVTDPTYLKEKVGVKADLGAFPLERVNPNGGSIALGHPFGATGARILSQATKELFEMPKGSKAIVSVCADGGLGTVALLEA